MSRITIVALALLFAGCATEPQTCTKVAEQLIPGPDGTVIRHEVWGPDGCVMPPCRPGWTCHYIDVTGR